MKRILASALSAALLMGALAGCGGNTGSGSVSGSNASAGGSSSGENVIKIGVFEPATGDSASGGKKEMLGMQYANSLTPTVEVGGTEYTVELVYADNGSSTDKAPTAASQLVSEGVSLVLGSYGSGVSIAGGPTFGSAGIPAIGVTCTNSIAYATQILSQAASLGIEAPFLGSDTLDDNMVLEAISGTDIQLYVSTFYQEGGNADFDAGIKEYINTAEGALDANGGNDTIAAVSAMGYDAYYVALEAIKAAGSTDPAAIKTALWDVTYTGVTGDIAFDDVNGDAIRDTAYIKHSTNDGAWELETVQTVEQ